MNVSVTAAASERAWDAPRARWSAPLCVIMLLACGVRVYLAPLTYGSDDVRYAIRGMEIALGSWIPSHDVGAIRYGINLPIAAFASLLGRTPATYVAWSFLCSLAEIALVFFVSASIWNVRTAIVAALLLTFTPLHIVLGGLALADAPLALAFSVALASFYFAETTRRIGWYMAAGVAAGIAWWIKPHAAVPFASMFVIYALLWRVLRREWLAVLAAGVGVVAAEFLLYGAAFGDPLFGIKAILGGVERNYIAAESPWGSSAPSFYLRQMFIDGRDLWLLPVFAVAGLVMLMPRGSGDTKTAFGPRYVIFWCLGLVGLFSLFVFHFNPLRWIPKQTNYMSIFIAPLAMSGGYALARLKNLPLTIALGVFAAGGVSLAALESYGMALHASGLAQSVSFADRHPDASLYVSKQAINIGYLANLSAGAVVPPIHLNPIDTRILEHPPLRGEAFLLVDRETPEFAEISRQPGTCWERVDGISRSASGPATVVLYAIAWLRGRLPAVVSRQFGFTDRLVAPRPVEVYRNVPSCRG